MAQPFGPAQVQPLTSPGSAGYVSQPVADNTLGTAIKAVTPVAEAAVADIQGAKAAQEITELGKELTVAQEELQKAEEQWRNAPESKKLSTLAQALQVGANPRNIRMKAKLAYEDALNTYAGNPQMQARVKRQFRKEFGDGIDEDKLHAQSAEDVINKPLSKQEQLLETAREKAKRDGSSVAEALVEIDYAQGKAKERRVKDKFGQMGAVVTHQFDGYVSKLFEANSAANGGYNSPEESKELADIAEHSKREAISDLFNQCTVQGGSPSDCQEIADRVDSKVQERIDTYRDRYDIVAAIKRDEKNKQTITRYNLEEHVPWLADMRALGAISEKQVGLVVQWLSGNSDAAIELQTSLSDATFNTVEDKVKQTQQLMQENGSTVTDLVYRGDPEGLRAAKGNPSSRMSAKRAQGKGTTPKGIAFATATLYADPNFGGDALEYSMTKNPETTVEALNNMVEQDPRYIGLLNTPHIKRVLNNHPEYAPQINELVKTNVDKNIRPLLAQTTDSTAVGIRELRDGADYVESKGEKLFQLVDSEGKTHNVVITTSADLTTTSGQQAVASIRDGLHTYYNNPKFGAHPIKRMQSMLNFEPEEEVTTGLEDEEKFVPPALDETPLSFKPRGVESISDDNVANVLNTNQAKRYYTTNPEKRPEVEPAMGRYVDNSVIPYMPQNYQGGMVIQQPKIGGDARPTVMIPDDKGNLVEAPDAVQENVRRLVYAVNKQGWLLEEGESAEEYVEDLIGTRYTGTPVEQPTPQVEEPAPDPRLEAMAGRTRGTGEEEVDPRLAAMAKRVEGSDQESPFSESLKGMAGMRKEPQEEGVLQPESPEDVKGEADEPSDERKEQAQWEQFADEQMDKGMSLDVLHQHWVQMFGPEDKWTSITKRQFMIVADRYQQRSGKMEEFE